MKEDREGFEEEDKERDLRGHSREDRREECKEGKLEGVVGEGRVKDAADEGRSS